MERRTYALLAFAGYWLAVWIGNTTLIGLGMLGIIFGVAWWADEKIAERH